MPLAFNTSLLQCFKHAQLRAVHTVLYFSYRMRTVWSHKDTALYVSTVHSVYEMMVTIWGSVAGTHDNCCIRVFSVNRSNYHLLQSFTAASLRQVGTLQKKTLLVTPLPKCMYQVSDAPGLPRAENFIFSKLSSTSTSFCMLPCNMHCPFEATCLYLNRSV